MPSHFVCGHDVLVRHSKEAISRGKFAKVLEDCGLFHRRSWNTTNSSECLYLSIAHEGGMKFGRVAQLGQTEL
jgi:hypothetical protein